MDRQQIARRGVLAALIVVGILLVDQLIKIWVKTNMTLHEQIEILSWFKIVFIENNGMAYGMEIGSKLVLSLFRVVAISVLGYYVIGQVKRQARWGYLVCLSMIFAGAVGNLIDRVGAALDVIGGNIFTVMRVIPSVIAQTWPDWVPFVGGNPYVFFSPVFNFADASISVGVVLLLLFYRKEISEISFKKKVKADEA